MASLKAQLATERNGNKASAILSAQLAAELAAEKKARAERQVRRKTLQCQGCLEFWETIRIIQRLVLTAAGPRARGKRLDTH